MLQLDVLCIGQAAYDISLAVDRHPLPDEKMQATALHCSGGGPAANAAVAVVRLGGRSAFCGYLGRDPYGHAHMQELQAEGVHTRAIARGDAPTPLSLILAKPDGTRSVVNHRAATPWIDAGAVSTAHLRPKVMLFDGHEPLLAANLLQQAKAAAIPTLLDAGSLHAGTRQLLSLVDHVVASRRFAREISGSEDPQEGLACLAERNTSVVITLGVDGLLWARNGGRGSLPAFVVETVDTTGAGDAFHGAFAFGLARNMAWQELLRFASAAAALTCTRLGARAGLPRWAQVHTLLKDQT